MVFVGDRSGGDEMRKRHQFSGLQDAVSKPAMEISDNDPSTTSSRQGEKTSFKPQGRTLESFGRFLFVARIYLRTYFTWEVPSCRCFLGLN